MKILIRLLCERLPNNKQSSIKDLTINLPKSMKAQAFYNLLSNLLIILISFYFLNIDLVRFGKIELKQQKPQAFSDILINKI